MTEIFIKHLMAIKHDNFKSITVIKELEKPEGN
jgi:hypothetical protein